MSTSTKKSKRAKTNRKRIERPIPNLDIENGEGFYAKIEKIVGGNRVAVELHTGEKQIATIMGRHRNKKWMRPGEYVLLNKYFEIEDIIRATHPKAAEANKYLKKISNDGGIVFKDYSDNEEESDEDIDEEDLEDVKNPTMGSLEKTKQLLNRKEKVKERDQSRRTGKSYTSTEVLESESAALNSVKGSINDDDINIDDI